MASNQKFSDRKVATHNRQKAILLLEKISKNMFRMFRDDETKKEAITKRFFELTKQLDKLGNVDLNAEYHRELKKYVDNLSNTFTSDFDLENIRSKNMSQLNRIQKIKNSSGYKREKNKRKKEREY